MTGRSATSTKRTRSLLGVTGAGVLIGVLGVATVWVAMIAELLSPAWAVAAGIAGAVTLASAALLMVIGARRGLSALRARSSQRDRDIARVIEAKLSDHATSSRRALDTRLAREARQTRRAVDRMYSQLEALDALNRMLEPSRPLPPLRGWAVSPDLALHVVGLVLDGTVRTVVEIGSGSSTVLIAMALEKAGSGRVVALEHDPAFADATRNMLREYDLTSRATVVDAPLAAISLDGEAFRWYDLDGVDLPDAVDLLFVDGPPEATGHHARYPALPLLLGALSTRALVVLDDGHRTGEAEVARRWAALPGVSDPLTLPVEREAAQFVVDRSAPDARDPATDRLPSHAR